jgi:hypothetical protein
VKTSLSDLITDINRTRKTGLLSINIRGSSNLFKMFFKEGETYHIAFGNYKGSECLSNLDTLDFSEYSFISDIKLDLKSDIPPTAQIVQLFKVIGKVVEEKGGGGTVSPGVSLDVRIGEALKTALTRQIGPAGGKVFTRVVEGKWRPSSTPTRDNLIELIELLKNEIDDADGKNEFVKEARKIVP